MREKYGCSAVLNEQHLLTWMLNTTPLLYNFSWLPVKEVAKVLCFRRGIANYHMHLSQQYTPAGLAGLRGHAGPACFRPGGRLLRRVVIHVSPVAGCLSRRSGGGAWGEQLWYNK
jgi:hypothetical protein